MQLLYMQIHSISGHPQAQLSGYLSCQLYLTCTAGSVVYSSLERIVKKKHGTTNNEAHTISLLIFYVLFK